VQSAHILRNEKEGGAKVVTKRCNGERWEPNALRFVPCGRDAEFMCVQDWESLDGRIHVCAEHKPPPGAFRSVLYIGEGRVDPSSKVIPIEALRAQRIARSARR
jgi:hypothetical protein